MQKQKHELRNARNDGKWKTEEVKVVKTAGHMIHTTLIPEDVFSYSSLSTSMYEYKCCVLAISLFIWRHSQRSFHSSSSSLLCANLHWLYMSGAPENRHLSPSSCLQPKDIWHTMGNSAYRDHKQLQFIAIIHVIGKWSPLTDDRCTDVVLHKFKAILKLSREIKLQNGLN